jgi:hypothetical protein
MIIPPTSTFVSANDFKQMPKELFSILLPHRGEFSMTFADERFEHRWPEAFLEEGFV